LGYPDQALKQNQEVLALARELGHPFSLADVLYFAGCVLNKMRRDAGALRVDAEELMRLAIETSPAWTGAGISFRGDALAMLGQVQDGINQMRQGIAAIWTNYDLCYLTTRLGSLADAQAKAGQPEDGLTTIAEALTLAEQSNEHHWLAELYRLKGELLLAMGDETGAEASLQKAIEVARRQQAKSWELRATVTLCRMWQQQGRTGEARRLLAEIYDWFTEGFNTTDLVEADALLQELACC
jgi:predicted ATPase